MKIIKRPEHMTCVRHTHEDKKRMSWCNRELVGEFYFLDIDHAVYNRMNEGRLTTCRDCVREIKKYLKI